MNSKKLAYDFVPIEPDVSVEAEQTSRAKFSKNCMTGELNVSMKTLTPLLCGHFQYDYKDLNDEAISKLFKGSVKESVKFSRDKKVLEPLVLPGDNGQPGQVLIPGSSIKGMLRNSAASLMSNPMERVNERAYSFRPNIKDSKNIYPAIITKTGDDGWSNIEVTMGDMNKYYFVSSDKNAQRELEGLFGKNNLENCIGKKIISRKKIKTYDYFTRQRKLIKRKIVVRDRHGEVNNKSLNDFILGRYHFGIDMGGMLYQAFQNQQNKRNTSGYKYGLFLPNKTGVRLPKHLTERFKETLNYLIDEKEGHLKDHPNPGNNLKKLKSKIEETLKSGLKVGDIVFIELQPGVKNAKREEDYRSMGFHFRYRWKYEDSIKKQSGKIRDEIFEDTKDFNTEKLLAVQELFGYVNEESKKALAGKVSVNFAIEQINNRYVKDRFLFADNQFWSVLKPLGSPKPSAVEMYLTQSNLSKRQDRGKFCTYGEFNGDKAKGDLKGRKVYPHQPGVNAEKTHFAWCKKPPIVEEIPTDSKAEQTAFLGQQTMLTRYISNTDTTFKFKVRFENLQKWEFALLLFVVSPEVKIVNQLIKALGRDVLEGDAKKAWQKIQNTEKVLFAKKLGHGRPLGLGSISCNIDEIKHWNFDNIDSPELQVYKYSENINSCIQDFSKYLLNKLGDKGARKWVNSILINWLEVQCFHSSSNDLLNYPMGRREIKDKYTKEVIETTTNTLNYFSQETGKHSSGRKKYKRR